MDFIERLFGVSPDGGERGLETKRCARSLFGFSEQCASRCMPGPARVPPKIEDPRSRRGLGGGGDDRGCAHAGDTVRGCECSCLVSRSNYLKGWAI